MTDVHDTVEKKVSLNEVQYLWFLAGIYSINPKVMFFSGIVLAVEAVYGS